MIRYILPTALVIALAIPTRAEQAPADPDETAIEQLAKQAPKRHLAELLDYNLAKLDAVYRKALANAPDDQHRKALDAAQKAWREFFTADRVVAAANAEGGSYASPAQLEQAIYQVRLRIYQLSTPFLQGWPEVPRVPKPDSTAAEDQQSGR